MTKRYIRSQSPKIPMVSMMNPEERMVVVRSVRLRPRQYRKHWDGIMPTKRSAHIRARLDHADNFDFLRDSVQWFATCMEVRLRENDDKGGWNNEPFQYFIDRMQDELIEIENAIIDIREGRADLIDLVNECVDLANFAMMLAENAHQVAMEPGDEEEEAEHDRE